MAEQELLDMFIQERINMLIDIFHKNQHEKSKIEKEQIIQAEIFIENLPDKEKILVEYYIDSFTKLFALEENFLYQHGLIDRTRILKYIDSL